MKPTPKENEKANIRRQFAGMAMQALLHVAAGTPKKQLGNFLEMCQQSGLSPSEQVAKMSFEMADVMIEREAKHPIK